MDGRDFCAEGKSHGKLGNVNEMQLVYNRTTAATVGTLVYEMSHGTFSAVDAPPVRKGREWKLAPNVNTWASPDNSVQSSTPELDKRLALKEPRAAIVNADNYGQLAVEAARLKGRSLCDCQPLGRDSDAPRAHRLGAPLFRSAARRKKKDPSSFPLVLAIEAGDQSQRINRLDLQAVDFYSTFRSNGGRRSTARRRFPNHYW